jgi:hypothetical protein
MMVSMLSALVLAPACGGRPLTSSADGVPAPQLDGQVPAPDHRPDRAAVAPATECAIAMRLDTCCPHVLPLPVAELKKNDPCVIPYSPYATIPAICEQRRPTICPAVACALLAPVTLLARALPDGTCTWKSECATDADCVLAEDCRAMCCGCGAVFPRVYAQSEVCVVYGSKSYPIAGCNTRCPDFCGEGFDPQPVATCIAVDSDPSLRRCEAAADPLAYVLWFAPGGESGTGPALELLGTGKLRAWKSVAGLQAHKTTAKADVELQLTSTQTWQIFKALGSIDFSGLPHKNAPSWDCYPHLHYDRNASGLAVDFAYSYGSDLLPELKTVYALIDPLLKPSGIFSPSTYCEWWD